MSHVFISYSRRDQFYARSLAQKLTAEGFNVWIDDRIDHGEDWWLTIVRALKSCDAFIVIMSPEADASRWVQREVTIADSLQKPAFPLLLAGDLLQSQNWTIYIRTQYTDVRDGQLPEADFYERLAAFTPRSQTQAGAEVQTREDLQQVVISEEIDDLPDNFKQRPETTTGRLRPVVQPGRIPPAGIGVGLVTLLVVAFLLLNLLRPGQEPPTTTPDDSTQAAQVEETESPTPEETASPTPTPSAEPTFTSEPVVETAPCTGVVLLENGQNLRTAPNGDILTRLPYNESVRVTELQTDDTDREWVRVEAGPLQGWLAAESLGFSGGCAEFGIAGNLYPAPFHTGQYNWARGFDPVGSSGVIHWGWDFAAAVGTEIRAGSRGGTVAETGYCAQCGDEGRSSLEAGFGLGDSRVLSDAGWNYGYGHYLIIRYDHEQLPASTQGALAAGYQRADVYCMYAQLQTYVVEEGQLLGPNETIAYSGNSGSSSGPHLHLECRAWESGRENFSWAAARSGLIDPGLLFTRAPLEE